MKKLLIGACICLLAGCSGGKEMTTKVCTGNIGGIEIETTWKASGDKIVQQSTINRTDLSLIGVTAEELKNILETEKSPYEDIKGITYSYDFEGEVIVETTEIDYEVVDMSVLEEMGIVDFGGQDAAVKFISLEESIKAIEAMGLTCK